tara:strand:+ start:3078 stop:3959 length:882 start_codon:yes stop_codon:yes gene_type:complete
MVKEQESFLPEYMRGQTEFTPEEKDASAYYPIFEVPLWTGQMSNPREITELMPHLKMSHTGSPMTTSGGDRMEQTSFPGGRPWSISETSTLSKVAESNCVNIMNDHECKQFVENIQKTCADILQHSPSDHIVHRDQIALTGVYVGLLPPGCALDLNIAPNNELVGLLILETPPMTGDLYFQDPAWITKTIVNHNASGNAFPCPEVTKQFSFDPSQVFLYPSWLPMSMTNGRRLDDPENDGIWFATIRLATRNRFLHPAVVTHDEDRMHEAMYDQVLQERDEYKKKLEELGELS